MIRRLIVLLGFAGGGLYLYRRFLRPQTQTFDDWDLPEPEEQPRGVMERATQAASGAAASAARAAQAPVDKVRSLVGSTGTPEGERVVTPEGGADPAAAELAAGYSPADERDEPAATPDAYRPAAEASPTATSAPRREGGATLPQEGGSGEQAPRATSQARPLTGTQLQPGAETPPPPPAPAPAVGPTVTDKPDEPEADAPEDLQIKGNVRADGDKIYHLPSDPAYERTNAETLFATVEEAEEAGFRRAGRPRKDE